MRHKLISILLVAVTAGAASAQVAGSSGSDINALRSNPVMTQATISSGSLTNSVLAGPSENEQVTYDLGPMPGKAFVSSRKLWSSDVMGVDGGVDGAFVDPEGSQVQRDILFHKLDLLLQADIRTSPVYFGVDSEVKFVERRDYQPGLPVPVGVSYRGGQQRFAFFAEFAPIFDPAPTTSLGWGGGVGVRFYFGR